MKKVNLDNLPTPKRQFSKASERWEHIANPQGFHFGDKVRITNEQELMFMFDSDEEKQNHVGILIGVATPNQVSENELIVFQIALDNGMIHTTTHNHFELIK